MSNACGVGYCSKGFSKEEVQECVSSARPDWNGLCAYQNGTKIDDPEEVIQLTCCANGCDMVAYLYANWNGLCAYQGQD
jgi:hypothetical protein